MAGGVVQRNCVGAHGRNAYAKQNQQDLTVDTSRKTKTFVVVGVPVCHCG